MVQILEDIRIMLQFSCEQPLTEDQVNAVKMAAFEFSKNVQGFLGAPGFHHFDLSFERLERIDS